MTPVSGLMGLASRAGQITLGAELALQEIRSGKAGLVLLDAEASEGTKKKLLDACAYRGVPAHMLPAGEISRACGRDGRMAAAVKKGKLCQRMLQLLPAQPSSQSQPDNPIEMLPHKKLQAERGGASIE